MNSQRSTGVTQVIVRRISERARSLKNVLRPSCFPKSHYEVEVEVEVELELDDTSYGNDIDLEGDRLMLRDLEAEIYTMTDQFNTEQGPSGVGSV